MTSRGKPAAAWVAFALASALASGSAAALDLCADPSGRTLMTDHGCPEGYALKSTAATFRVSGDAADETPPPAPAEPDVTPEDALPPPPAPATRVKGDPAVVEVAGEPDTERWEVTVVNPNDHPLSGGLACVGITARRRFFSDVWFVALGPRERQGRSLAPFGGSAGFLLREVRCRFFDEARGAPGIGSWIVSQVPPPPE